MNLHFAAATKRAITMLPVLVAALAFSLLPPARPAEAAGFVNAALLDTRGQTTGTILPPPPPPAPDLLVFVSGRYVEIPGGPVVAGNQHAVELEIVVRNVGGRAVSEAQVAVSAAGKETRYSAYSLAAGSGIHYKRLLLGCQHGQWTVRVDPDNAIYESNESNNSWVQELC